MKILICGGGSVGSSIAHQLTLENNDVNLIDMNPDVVTEVTEHLDVRGYIGHPSHPSVLEEAGVRDADVIIAVTGSDEVNMIICQVAYSLFDVNVRIARIRNTDYLRPEWQLLYRHDHIPIDHIISPEQQVAQTIFERLHIPGSIDTISLGGDGLVAVGLRCGRDSDIPGKRLSSVRDLCAQHNSVMLGLVRGGAFIVPQKGETVQAEDVIYIVCRHEHIPALMPLFGHEDRRARDIVIIGAGNIGTFLTDSLEKSGEKQRIRLVENSRDVADRAAARFTGASLTVLHGNAMSEAIMRDAGIARADSVIAVTNDDKVNILASLIAKKAGARHAVALINNERAFTPILADSDIDITVNPREITVSSILHYIRAGKVLSLRSMCFGKVELLEIAADENSPVAGKDIYGLGLPQGIVIGAVSRGETLITPMPDTVIRAGDMLTVLCEADAVHKAENIFSYRKQLY